MTLLMDGEQTETFVNTCRLRLKEGRGLTLADMKNARTLALEISKGRSESALARAARSELGLEEGQGPT